MTFPQDFINNIILGDCVETMKEIPDGSVDLVVTSPPYNLKNSTGNGMKDGRGGKWANAALVNGYHNYDDCMPHDKYVKWQRACYEAIYLIAKNDFKLAKKANAYGDIWEFTQEMNNPHPAVFPETLWKQFKK